MPRTRFVIISLMRCVSCPKVMFNRRFSTMKSALRAAALAAGFVCVFASLSGMAAAVPVVTPEIDAGSMASALTLLSGGLLILTGRRKVK